VTRSRPVRELRSWSRSSPSSRGCRSPEMPALEGKLGLVEGPRAPNSIEALYEEVSGQDLGVLRRVGPHRDQADDLVRTPPTVRLPAGMVLIQPLRYHAVQSRSPPRNRRREDRMARADNPSGLRECLDARRAKCSPEVQRPGRRLGQGRALHHCLPGPGRRAGAPRVANQHGPRGLLAAASREVSSTRTKSRRLGPGGGAPSVGGAVQASSAALLWREGEGTSLATWLGKPDVVDAGAEAHPAPPWVARVALPSRPAPSVPSWRLSTSARSVQRRRDPSRRRIPHAPRESDVSNTEGMRVHCSGGQLMSCR